MASHRVALRAVNRPPHVAAFVLALVSTGCLAADLIKISWDADGRFAGKQSVAPGKFLEVCGALPSGTKVTWNFGATAAVDFNVHYHAGSEVVFPSKLTAVTGGNDVLHAEADQDFCWMWTNTSRTSSQVTFRLQR